VTRLEKVVCMCMCLCVCVHVCECVCVNVCVCVTYICQFLIGLGSVSVISVSPDVHLEDRVRALTATHSVFSSRTLLVPCRMFFNAGLVSKCT